MARDKQAGLNPCSPLVSCYSWFRLLSPSSLRLGHLRAVRTLLWGLWDCVVCSRPNSIPLSLIAISLSRNQVGGGWRVQPLVAQVREVANHSQVQGTDSEAESFLLVLQVTTLPHTLVGNTAAPRQRVRKRTKVLSLAKRY